MVYSIRGFDLSDDLQDAIKEAAADVEKEVISDPLEWLSEK